MEITPVLPNIIPLHGQCLPAAVACLLNRPDILNRPESQPKQNDFVFGSLHKFIETGFDIVYASEYAINEDEWFNLFNYDGFTELELIPMVVAEPGDENKSGHAFAVLYDPNELWVFWYDLLRMNTGDAPIDAFTETFSINRMAVFLHDDDNSILTTNLDECPWLINIS